jgi:hypothetical protein
VIGPERLSEIREELRRALSGTADPIRELEERLAASHPKKPSQVGEGEVMQSLRRVLEATPGRRGRRRSVETEG